MNQQAEVKLETLSLYARPYNIEYIGFLFSNFEDYKINMLEYPMVELKKEVSHSGISTVIDVQIELIDGDENQKLFAKLYPPEQHKLKQWFRNLEKWGKLTKIQQAAHYYLMTHYNELKIKGSCLDSVDKVKIFKGRKNVEELTFEGEDYVILGVKELKS